MWVTVGRHTVKAYCEAHCEAYCLGILCVGIKFVGILKNSFLTN